MFLRNGLVCKGWKAEHLHCGDHQLLLLLVILLETPNSCSQNHIMSLPAPNLKKDRCHGLSSALPG